ncbi:MAG: hypothetical protein FRX49_05063 [Trebouxia sp. A1-2]|nr:MAG: hypothetical protein FRX49_05063 [Trebouxia sp. A1-2]
MSGSFARQRRRQRHQGYLRQKGEATQHTVCAAIAEVFHMFSARRRHKQQHQGQFRHDGSFALAFITPLLAVIAVQLKVQVDLKRQLSNRNVCQRRNYAMHKLEHLHSTMTILLLTRPGELMP